MKQDNRCILSGFGDGYPEALCGPLYFSWYSTEKAGTQRRYQLKVWNKEELYWDSGWIDSAQSDNVQYSGKTLESDCDYEAQVVIEDETGNRLESNRVSFGTALDENEWHAKWLRSDFLGPQTPLIRKSFMIEKEVVRAKLYISGLGYQESYINGHKPGKDVLSPTWTDYRKRVSYNAYDITKYLQLGNNVLGIELGHGWYGKFSGGGDENLIFIAQISLEYANGEKEWIYSRRNDGWLVYAEGPLKQSSIFIGEFYDARDEVDGWKLPQTDISEAKGWKECVLAEPPAGEFVPQNIENIEPVMEFQPVTIKKISDDAYIVDFGQNMSGVVELEIAEEKGQEVHIRYAEILGPDGFLSTENLRSAQAEDIYISNGTKALYRPKFTYHGFRYVEVTGFTRQLEPSMITAYTIRNAVSVTGDFHAECELLNQIQHICVWAEGTNLHGVPTDCPQRDERLGWLNDLNARIEGAIYNFDMHRFYTKYLQDIRDAQGKTTGALTDTVPFVGYGNQPADPVCSSYLTLGWYLYMYYGDRRAMEIYYDGYAAWVEYLVGETKDGIVAYSYYGDWAAPLAGSKEGSRGAGAISSITPGELISTGFLYYDAVLMGGIAKTLGKTEDIAKWSKLAEETKAALNRTYYQENGSYATGSQACNALMAWLNVSPDKEKTVQALVEDIYKQNVHLTTGNICTRFMLEVLAENGYMDLAYDIVTQTTYPSWGYMVENGATTTWERWEFVNEGPQLEMASHNHPMNASVSAWFYKYLLGIRPVKPGFEEFQIRPYIPKKLSGVKGSLKTVKGMIETSWKQNENGQLLINVTVPFNTTCHVITPPGWERQEDKEVILDAGEHQLTYTRVGKEK